MPFQPASAGLEAQALEQVERELEPVGLLGVDVEADVVAARAQRELLQDADSSSPCTRSICARL